MKKLLVKWLDKLLMPILIAFLPFLIIWWLVELGKDARGRKSN